MARLHGLVAVDLDFVVVLRADRKRNNTEGTENAEGTEIFRVKDCME
jgi:hypothetical protein